MNSYALVLGAIALPFVLGSSSAQCLPEWDTHGFRGPVGAVLAATPWDPDGAGPLASRLAIATSFTHISEIGDVLALDPVTTAWTRIGQGMDGGVTAIAALPNGHLVAAGRFLHADGRAAARVARWDGVQWNPLGAGLSDEARCLAVMPNGDIVAGGRFQTAGGVTVRGIARWNGLAWSPFGTGMSDVVEALCVMPNGDVVAGGRFATAGGVAANCLARWNGTSWAAVGGSIPGVGVSSVLALAVGTGGDLFVTGYLVYSPVASSSHIARWDGTAWHALGTGINGLAYDLTVMPNGDVVAGGDFTAADGAPAAHVARWNGTNWNALGSGVNAGVRALTTLQTGELIVGGGFTSAGGVPAVSVASWNGAWSAINPQLSAGFDARIRVVSPLRSGGALVGGEFAFAGGIPAAHIARQVGSAWSALGAGLPQTVHSAIELRNGDILAGGGDGDILTGYTGNLRRWNGTSWQLLATTNGIVTGLAEAPNGDIYAGGYFSLWNGAPVGCIVRWNGSAWVPLGAGTDWPITTMAMLPNGHVVVGGYFTAAGGVPANFVARWDGAAWFPIGSGVGSYVHEVRVMRNGDLVVAGEFTTAGGGPAARVARWNGTAWAALGAGIGTQPVDQVLALAELPNGHLVAGGTFATAGGVAAQNVARWNGAAWSAIDGGASEIVMALATLGNGEVGAGGEFLTAGSVSSPFFARLVATCPASANAIATTCSATAGPVALVGDTLPWTGSTFRSTASGFGPNAFAVSLLGLSSPNVPLTWVWPNSFPGCNQLASQEAILLHLPIAGATQYAFTIPNSTAYAGVTLFHQFLQFELTPTGNLGPLSSSNGLQVVIGSL